MSPRLGVTVAAILGIANSAGLGLAADPPRAALVRLVPPVPVPAAVVDNTAPARDPGPPLIEPAHPPFMETTALPAVDPPPAVEPIATPAFETHPLTAPAPMHLPSDAYMTRPARHRFSATPFGLYVRSHMQAQIDNGLAARLVLYRYDFGDGLYIARSKLNRRGWQQLQRLGSWVATTGLPLVIERSGDEELDQARLHHVRSMISQASDASPEFVHLRSPQHRLPGGISGWESQFVYENLLQQTIERGRTEDPDSSTVRRAQTLGIMRER